MSRFKCQMRTPQNKSVMYKRQKLQTLKATHRDRPLLIWFPAASKVVKIKRLNGRRTDQALKPLLYTTQNPF